MNIVTYNDFFVKLPFAFDIAELRKATHTVRNLAKALTGKDFNETYTLALNHKKNGHPWEGQNVRGLYWTRPDDSYEEVSRCEQYDEMESRKCSRDASCDTVIRVVAGLR